eukprot:TRINITY_DN8716_c0_g1_i2.p1 TRINITY_DN8716_c0_g1~~TRINITY_DN8716_c0_g1_i2.p1  ORF type:complete len:600 (+),score=107.33 TRINITY_DN8716_c0_g1_i2:33-1832(+)
MSFHVSQSRLRVRTKVSSDPTAATLETMLSYVPQMVISHYLDNPQLESPEEAKPEHFPAAVLFVDISGFTSLNEQYAKQVGGIEIVTKHINGYFKLLVELIQHHGGDVLKFAGDALIVAFGNSVCTESLETQVLRATQCGLEIQDKLQSYDAGSIKLTLHIAVGAGTLWTFHLGGINRQYEFFPVGNVFGQISDALDKSKSGEVFLSAPAWELVSDFCEGEEQDGDWFVSCVKKDYQIPTKPLPRLNIPVDQRERIARILRSYISIGIQDRIDAGQSQWLAEMRRISVLFVNLQGLKFQVQGKKAESQPQTSSNVSPLSSSTQLLKGVFPTTSLNFGQDDSPQPEEEEDQGFDEMQLNEVLKVAQKVIFRGEGFLRQFLVDDKGCTLIAVFGVFTSHADDAIRAVHAALCIKNQLKSLGLKSYMGVTTGQAFCGTVGCSASQEYAVVGDIVNLSARLMVASYKGQHGILCDSETNEIAGQKFNLKPLEPIMVKGKKDLIPIFLPRKPSNDARHGSGIPISETHLKSDDCFGREAEIGIVFESLESLVGSDSFCIACEGAEGMGKTKLSMQVIKMALSHWELTGSNYQPNRLCFRRFYRT